jgi:hypothetical protein
MSLPAAFITDWPVATDPVKLTLSTSGCDTKAAPATGPKPLMTLMTPNYAVSIV